MSKNVIIILSEYKKVIEVEKIRSFDDMLHLIMADGTKVSTCKQNVIIIDKPENVNRCVSCGEVIPEGQQYCGKCEKGCNTCIHEKDNSGYCLECHYGNKWQMRKDEYEIVGNIHDNIKCKDCKYLMFSDMYGECSKAYKGIVRPDDSCGKGKPRK